MVDSIVKVCPQCNHVNGARRDKCEKCGFSLLNVKRVMASSLSKEQTKPASVDQAPATDNEPSSSQKPPKFGPENEYNSPARDVSRQPKPVTAMRKICPHCYAVNPANITTCSECQGDISSVQAIPEDKVSQELARLKGVSTPDSPPDQPNDPPFPAPEQKEMVRLCDNPECGHINPANIRFCEKCGAPVLRLLTRQEAEAELINRPKGPNARLQSPRPTPQPEVLIAKSARLGSLDGRFSYQAVEGTVTLGRQSEMREYLIGRNWVSRNHSELSFQDGFLTVTDVDSTNGTFVNGIKLKAHTPQRLNDGDILSLGAGTQRTEEDRTNAAFFKVELM